MIRFLPAALAAAILSLSAASAQEAAPERLSASALADLLSSLQKPEKPVSEGGVSPAAYAGDDSCVHALDGECDDPVIGTGACTEFTDYSDCWRIATGVEDDSCRWANDGECDEPRFGTGACAQATDYTDCTELIPLRGQDDECALAFNGVCDVDPDGEGACEARSDRADCIGRERPLNIADHFYGYDERELVDTSVFPWSVIGSIEMDSEGECTASLVGPDVLLTAAHCISGFARLDARGEFITGQGLEGGPRRARIIDYFSAPDWDEARFFSSDRYDEHDWAFLRIDTPLGEELGYLRMGAVEDYLPSIGPAVTRPRPRAVKPQDGAEIAAPADRLAGAPTRPRPGRGGEFTLSQAGYSWDTGEHLSGASGCQVLELFDEAVLSHDCSTTHGDSGSPLMVRDGEYMRVIAIASRFRDNPDGPMKYIAVRAESWAAYFEDFAAGRLGAGGPRPAGPGKPDKN